MLLRSATGCGAGACGVRRSPSDVVRRWRSAESRRSVCSGAGWQVACAILLLAASVGRAQADQYLPLCVGNWWEYLGSYLGEHEIQRVERTEIVSGQEVYCIVYRESTHNEGLTQYWTAPSDGTVNLWGWVLSDGYGILYDPPIKMIEAPLWLGKIWEQSCAVYNLPGMTLIGVFDFDCKVYEEFDLAVPAGGFHVYGVGFTEGLTRPYASRDIAGQWIGVGKHSEAYSWWSDQVGIVQYSTSDMYQLVGFPGPTPVSQTSWGHVKALYAPSRVTR